MKRKRKLRNGVAYRGAQDRPAAKALQHAISLLNPCNLHDLWKLSTVMSLTEIAERDLTRSSAWQIINVVRLRLFAEAILRSKAAEERTGRLEALSLRNILDDLQNAMNDEDALAELEAANRTDRAVFEFNRFMARLASTQIAEQDPLFQMRCGRLLGLFTYLPREQRDKVASRDVKDIDNILPRIERALGSPIDELIRVIILIFNLYHDRYLKLSLTPVPPALPGNERHRGQAADHLLRDLLAASARTSFVLTPQGISSLTKGMIRAETVCNVLKLLSKTTDELRTLHQVEPVYQLGHPTTSLSPLDRFPIVRLDAPIGASSRFVVPNMRLPIKSLSSSIDYSLVDAIGTDYNQARGSLQELYLCCLVEEKFPHLCLIPERPYGKIHERGPDLVLVEQATGKMLLVESKAQRMWAATRHRLTEELLNSNLRGPYEALLKLPRKLNALYAGLPEYKDVQSTLDRSRSVEPICVVVVSDSVFSMSELIRIMAHSDTSHPLRDYPYKFAIVSMDTFERAVHVALESGQSLYDVFAEHWRASGRNLEPPYDHVSANADSLGGIAFPESSTFGASFFQRAQGEWARNLPSTSTDPS